MDDPVAAAERIAAWMVEHPLDLTPALVEMVAWTLVRAGRVIPTPAQADNATYAALSAAVATQNASAFDSAISEAYNRGPEAGYSALLEAEVLGSTLWPDQVARHLQHYGEPMPARYVVHALATIDPVTALELIDGLGDIRLNPDAVEALAELVVTARDVGAPHPQAEARWAALEQDNPIAGAQMAWLDMRIRLATHQDLEAAIDELEETAGWYGWHDLQEGPLAVLGRLVRLDAARACELASTGDTVASRADLLQALVWWGSLPEPAVPMLDALLDEIDPEADLLVASVLYSLVRTADLARLRTVLERCRPAAETVVVGVAPAVRRLRLDGSSAVDAVLAVAMAALPPQEITQGPAPADCLTVQGGFDLSGPWWQPYGSDLP